MSNIKDYRNKELIAYIIAQVLIIILFHNPEILKFDVDDWQKTLFDVISSAIFSSVIGVFSFVFDAMFGEKIKHKLLYFGTKRPGEVIFKNIETNHKDYRYTQEKALEKYHNIYENMPKAKKDKSSYQNDQWYQLYSKHRNVPIIFNSHRDYLLCRDIYFATILVSVFYIFIIFLNNISISWNFIILELALLIVSNIATRQRAKRFVGNVIAYDLQDSTKSTYDEVISR